MQRRVGPGGRERSGVRAVQHPAPDRDPGHRRPCARRARAPRDRAVPADGWRLRRQGVPAARPGRGGGAGRDTHRASGQSRPEPDPGHHDDRQAASFPGGVGGRIRPGSADLCAARDADQQRRLEPRPVRAGAGPGAVSHRQRLLHPAHPRDRPDRQDQPAVQHGVPGLRRPAGHDRDRGHPRPMRAAARRGAGRATPAQPVRGEQHHAVRPAGPARRTARRHLEDPHRAQRSRGAGRPRSPSSMPSTTTSNAAWRSRRSSSGSRST